jgi:CxxC motif-containing protein
MRIQHWNSVLYKKGKRVFMKALTCIVCPIGCSLTVEEGQNGKDGSPELKVSGNTCPRGEAYAREEIRAPKRVVTATCGIDDAHEEITDDTAAKNIRSRSLYAPRRVPVKTDVPCPREKISALLEDIYKIKVKLPVAAGDSIIADWQNSGINVVAVRNFHC